MVLIAPPPGWTPAVAAAIEYPASGPPPLDRVAAEPSMLDLEPAGGSWFQAIFGGNVWLLAAVVSTFVLLGICLLCWRWTRATEPEPVVVAAEKPAVAVKETKAGRTSSPRSQSGGVSAPQTPPKAVAPPPTSAAPATPSITPSPTTPPPEAKPAKADPPPSAAEAAKKPAKEEKASAKQEAKQPETKKLPPAPVDVAARMADPLPGIELTDVPLASAVDLLATVSTLPITLDPDAMRQLGLTPRDPISLRLNSTTIGQALQAVAAKRGLAAMVDNGQVILTLPAEDRESLRTVPYTVSDLTGDDKAAVMQLAALVKEFVAAETWREVGGRGTVEPKERSLTITQTRDVHWQVLVFCEKLRNARNKPLRSHDRPEQFTLTTRTSQARRMLDRPVSVNFHEPVPLGRILDFLAKATDSDILIDHAALAAAETSDRVETSLTVQKRPLAAVLDNLLRPLGLAYRAVGPGAIQVTSAEAAADHLEVEFYPVAPLLAKDSPLPLGEGPAVRAAKLIERLKTKVAAPTWNDVGGPGVVYLDAPSQCLIVLQSQSVQAAVERLLTAREAGESGRR